MQGYANCEGTEKVLHLKEPTEKVEIVKLINI